MTWRFFLFVAKMMNFKPEIQVVIFEDSRTISVHRLTLPL